MTGVTVTAVTAREAGTPNLWPMTPDRTNKMNSHHPPPTYHLARPHLFALAGDLRALAAPLWWAVVSFAILGGLALAAIVF